MKVELLGIGLDTLWSQFDGLPCNLKKNHKQIKTRIAGIDVDVADAWMVDNLSFTKSSV